MPANRRRLICASTLALACAAVAAPPVGSAESARQLPWAFRSCGSIARGQGLPWTLRAKGISCSLAHRLVALASSNRLPAGWNCAASALLCWRGSLRAGPERAAQAFEAFPRHYEGYTEGTSARGLVPEHRFVVGDGFSLVFRDNWNIATAYRVCWGPSGRAFTRCWNRRTAFRGAASKVFTAAPPTVGIFVVRWYVAGRQVAQWSFHNGQGD